jgi:hypothetical protein
VADALKRPETSRRTALATVTLCVSLDDASSPGGVCSHDATALMMRTAVAA